MKLVGEYELTEDGVVIEGKINNSHIYEIRNLLKPLGEIKMYHGEKPKGCNDPTERPVSYKVPHSKYRPFILRYLPGLITPEIEREFVAIQKSFKDNPSAIYYHDTPLFHGNLGVMYNDGEGKAIMQDRAFISYLSMKRNTTKLITNSAWVWNVAKDGSFKIELNGLVNRHMMTVVLENATKLAKYIDTVLVKTLDKPDVFSEVVVRAYNRI